MKDTMIGIVKGVAYGIGYITKAIEIGYKEGQKACKIENVVTKIDAFIGSKKEEA